jgi:hypothetical protein
MSAERALAALLCSLAALLSACDAPTCLRNSDCPPSLTCSTSGVCGDGLVAIDAGEVSDAVPDAAVDAAADAAVDAAVDAVADAAVDAAPPTLDPTPDNAPPIVIVPIDAGELPVPPLDPIGASSAPAILAAQPDAP